MTTWFKALLPKLGGASVLVLTLVLTACGSVASPTASAGLSATASSPAATESSPATTGPSPAGSIAPSTWADWMVRQGFGGGVGLPEILKGTAWLNENAATATAGDVQFWRRIAERLSGWLDAHPPTDCWLAYHGAMRSVLTRMAPEFAELQRQADASMPLSADTTARLAALAAEAEAVPIPENCP